MTASDGTNNPAKPGKTWKNLGVRFFSAVFLIGLCTAPFYFGGNVWAVLVALLGARLTYEWVRMSDPGPTRLAYIIPIIGLIAAIGYLSQSLFSFSLISLALAAALAAIERARRGGLLWAGLGYLYIVVPCLAIIALRGNEIGFNTTGFKQLLFVILVVAAADVGAYFGGSFFKGPKLSPRLSPNKTWSGVFSGMALAVLSAVVYGKIIGLSIGLAVLLAIPVVIFSVLGDLLESGLKRTLNVKDTGSLMPGHGGLLDRLDSLMLSVVCVAVILHFVPGIWPL